MKLEILSKTDVNKLVKIQALEVQKNLFEELDKMRERIFKLEEEVRLVLKYYSGK